MAAPDLEILISSDNRFVASLAVSTLLQTCDEKSVEALLTQISSYLEDMGEDFVIEVVNCIRALVSRMPRKADAFVSFLSKLVSPPSNATDSTRAKRACVEAIHAISKSQPKVARAAMLALAEFIEDCTSPSLSCTVLQILADEVPLLRHDPNDPDSDPAVFVHAIYNRVILEKTQVRVAAVSALGRLARSISDPALRNSIRSLLGTCIKDPDHELRERASMLSEALAYFETAASSEEEGESEIDDLYAFALGERTLDLHLLEDRLVKAVEDPS